MERILNESKESKEHKHKSPKEKHKTPIKRSKSDDKSDSSESDSIRKVNSSPAIPDYKGAT